jgi:hypothetical protein
VEEEKQADEGDIVPSGDREPDPEEVLNSFGRQALGCR